MPKAIGYDHNGQTGQDYEFLIRNGSEEGQIFCREAVARQVAVQMATAWTSARHAK